jgi:hypothetical protein
MSTPRRKTQEVDPEKYFSDWHYVIGRHHWGAFGIEKREFIDKKPTEAKRAEARAEGKDAKTVARIKVMRQAWVNCGMADLHEFEVFWSKDNMHALQIVSIKDMIEVHRVVQGEPRLAYLLTEARLIAAVQTGTLPEEARIWQAHSESEVLRYAIANPSSKGAERDD